MLTDEERNADDGRHPNKSSWCAAPSATTSPPVLSTVAELESGVPGNWPAPFGAGERPRGPTYRYKESDWG